MSDEKTLIIVPTYNERENILELLRVLLDFPEWLHVLVVDDGSPDGTAQLVKEHGEFGSRVHLLERSGKLGLGRVAAQSGGNLAATCGAGCLSAG